MGGVEGSARDGRDDGGRPEQANEARVEAARERHHEPEEQVGHIGVPPLDGLLSQQARGTQDVGDGRVADNDGEEEMERRLREEGEKEPTEGRRKESEEKGEEKGRDARRRERGCRWLRGGWPR